MSSPETPAEMKMSRRRLLRSALLLSAAGAGIVFGVKTIAAATTPGPNIAGASATSSLESPDGGQATPDGSLKVKVLYLQMSRSINTNEEYFVLKSPARLRDLLTTVEAEHPVIATMLPTMTIFVQGYGAQPTTPLNDGDEIDIVPALAGG